MVARKNQEQTPRPPRRPPATTPEEREHELIEAAVDLAERQLRDGTASAQVISHYLKLGSSRERLEQERLRHENDFLVAKREALEAQQQIGNLIEDALQAMRRYQGVDDSMEQMDENY